MPEEVATRTRGRSQRARILAAALDLMATHGAEGMTMRQLAAACDLNIATLYHYVGSKSDLLAAIVDQRHYDDGLRDLVLPVDPALPSRDRLARFLTAVATASLGELRLWRLLVGEGLRADPVARAEARRLAAALDGAVDRWLGELFPELGVDRAAVTSVVTGQLLATYLLELLLADDPGAGGAGGSGERIARRAAATAAVVFPAP
jgi:AcrR family transcriptional regulator